MIESTLNAALRLIHYLIGRLFAGQPQATSIIITLAPSMPVGQTVTIQQTAIGRIMITLRDDYRLPLQVSGLDAKGQAAPLENLRYASSDPNIADVDTSGLVTVGPLTGVTLPAQAQITVTADAQVGSGQNDIMGIVDLSVVAGQAVTLTVGGTPEPVPAPAP